MTNFDDTEIRLDPWAASSLLQKAIRRGETGSAIHAARELHRYRGKAIFRRLMNIAFEDVGIANPCLVEEVAFLALEKEARAVLGSDWHLVIDLTTRLAASPKDRCTDYLVCWSLKSAAGISEQQQMSGMSDDELVAIAADWEQPLLSRAGAALIACTRDAKILYRQPLVSFLEQMEAQFPCTINSAVERAARSGIGSYVLMAPILWSAMQSAAHDKSWGEPCFPKAESVGGIPLYTFDKHTSVGKRAIFRLTRENEAVRAALAKASPGSPPEDVAAMAAFYADAVPVSPKLEWIYTPYLEKFGFEADMLSVGCRAEEAQVVLDAVSGALPHLNELRREILLSRSASGSAQEGGAAR